MKKRNKLVKFLGEVTTYPGHFIEDNSIRHGGKTWKTDAYSMLMEIYKLLHRPK